MIKTEIISANALKIVPPKKLKADDFSQISPQVDFLILQQGQIRLLIDASECNGWENVSAFETHARRRSFASLDTGRRTRTSRASKYLTSDRASVGLPMGRLRHSLRVAAHTCARAICPASGRRQRGDVTGLVIVD